jgi:hypothetical protein
MAARARVAADMRPVPLLLLLSACAAAGDAGPKPAASDHIFADDFESGTLAAWADGVDPARQRVRTGENAQSGSHYLEVTYPAGGDGGWLTRFFLPGYDSIYVSYYVRFPEDWVGGTKLIGLFGSRVDDQWSAAGKAGACPQGEDFFIAMVVTEPTGNPGPMRFYTYYPTMTREPDGTTCWGRYGDGSESYVEPLTLARGVWHHIEFFVKLNTPSRADGSQQLWIDGAQRGAWSGLAFRSSNVLRLNAVQLSFNRGISGGPATQTLLVDNLLVAETRPAP